jgi:hypothetical protein
MRKLLVALGLGAAVTLGAGASIAQTDSSPRPPAGATMPHDHASTDAMHGQMRDSMPADMVAACDEMHASMTGHMAGMSGMVGQHMPR